MATVWWTQCPVCKRHFAMTRDDAVYCGSPCRQRAYRRRQRGTLKPARRDGGIRAVGGGELAPASGRPARAGLLSRVLLKHKTLRRIIEGGFQDAASYGCFSPAVAAEAQSAS